MTLEKESEIERERLSDANRQLERINQQVAQQQEDVSIMMMCI